MKLIIETCDEKVAKLKLTALHSMGIKGIIKYDNHYKIYKVYQTNKIPRRRDKIARIIHSEFPIMSKVNQTSRDKLLRTATFNELDERQQGKYFRVANRIIMAIGY